MNKNVLKVVVVSLFLSFVVISCKDKLTGGGKGTVNVRISANPDMLNAINTTTSDGRRISDLIYGVLVNNDPVSFDLVPYLVKENAKISKITSGEFAGGMKLDYEMREDAVWDDGSPITGYDYAFTIKAILNPKTNCEPLKGYYDWMGDVVVDSSNPKKFSVLSKKLYYKIEEFAGGYVFPENIYDPEGLMRKFSIKDLNSPENKNDLKSNTDILKFAEFFNGEDFQRNPDKISGSGPYKLEKWITGQELVLVKKDSWWGDKHSDLRQFWAYPKRIKFKVINDDNTAITALKDNQLDIYYALRTKDYRELEKNKEFTSGFKLEKISRLAYTYFGINLRNPKFKDLKVRKALAHAVNRDKINEVIAFGESEKTESFLHPSQPCYNHDIKEYEFDLEKASTLLEEAGWIDSDGDGLRDNIVEGKRIPLEIEFKSYKNETVKDIALLIKEDMKKIGIDFRYVEKEWTVFVSELDRHNFEMYNIGFTISPTMSDPKQGWHTSSSVAGGSNNVGWGDAQSDKMIEDLGSSLDANKRCELYKKIQQKIHDEVPVIFMFNSKNKIATSKKFEVEKIMISPGVRYNEFKKVN